MAETFEQAVNGLASRCLKYQQEDYLYSGVIEFARAVAKWQASRDAEICDTPIFPLGVAAERLRTARECSHAILKAAEEL